MEQLHNFGFQSIKTLLQITESPKISLKIKRKKVLYVKCTSNNEEEQNLSKYKGLLRIPIFPRSWLIDMKSYTFYFNFAINDDQ
jgi:hypothetical protein